MGYPWWLNESLLFQMSDALRNSDVGKKSAFCWWGLRLNSVWGGLSGIHYSVAVSPLKPTYPRMGFYIFTLPQVEAAKTNTRPISFTLLLITDIYIHVSLRINCNNLDALNFHLVPSSGKRLNLSFMTKYLQKHVTFPWAPDVHCV